MKLTELVLDHIEITQHTKEATCREHKGPSDLAPMLLWVDNSDQTNVMVLAVEGRPTQYMPEALQLVVKQDPKFVIFICESLGMSLDSTEDFQNFSKTHKSGDLEAIYKERGPLSNVEEIIVFNAIDLTSGEQVQGITKFKYDDFGHPIFGETTVYTLDQKYVNEASVTSMLNQFHLWVQAKRASRN